MTACTVRLRVPEATAVSTAVLPLPHASGHFAAAGAILHAFCDVAVFSVSMRERVLLLYCCLEFCLPGLCVAQGRLHDAGRH